MQEKRSDLLKISEERLLYRVSKLYYEDGYTQSRIADMLNIHRTTVGRMLQKAQREGIVKIKIQSSYNKQFELEKKLIDHFGMKEVIIIPDEENYLKNKIAEVTYDFLDRILIDGDVVGLNWGTTLGNIFSQSFDVEPKEIECVPLVGGPGDMEVDFHVNTITLRFAQTFSGNPNLIDAAAVYKSIDTAKEVMSSMFMKKVINLWERLTVAIVGIGSPKSSSNLVWSGFYGEADQLELEKHDAYGEICSRFFNSTGEPIISSVSDRTIAIDLHELKDLRYSIGIAYSKEKTNSIIAAMKGRLINTLITTEETALNINKYI